VLRAIGQSDPLRAKELLAKYPQYSDREVTEGLANGLSDIDLRAGAETALRICHSGDLEEVGIWARAEPDAALAWAKGIPAAERRVKALESIVKQWADSNPERIGPAIQGLPPSQSRNRLFTEQAARLARTDPEAALAWARSADSVTVQQACLGEVAATLAARDPAKAEEILRSMDWSARFDGGTGVNEQSGLVALTELAGADPQRALALADSLPPDKVAGARRSAFDSWVNHDPRSASEWLAALPPERRDAGCVGSLVNFLSQGPAPDYPAALQWAASLNVEAGRPNFSAQEVIRNWMQSDPAAADKALAIPSLPESVRDFILRRRQPQPSNGN
jgi:hypothetical protein